MLCYRYHWCPLNPKMPPEIYLALQILSVHIKQCRCQLRSILRCKYCCCALNHWMPAGIYLLFQIHLVSTESLDAIARQLRTGNAARVVAVRWLVGVDRRRGKAASSVVVYFSGVVPVHGRVVRFGEQWCPIDRYEFGRRGGGP